MRVFLAHASAQQLECKKIAIKLRARGFTVFYSEDGIAPSEDFNSVIRSEIARCDLMIFLLSPASVATGCYALTELAAAERRWPSPRGRILAVVTAPVALRLVPAYLRDNIELLRPVGDLATETADAAAEIRRARLRRRLSMAGLAASFVAVVLGALVWNMRLAAAARLSAVSDALVGAARQAPIYLDTCATKLESFAKYRHEFKVPEHACDPQPVLDSLTPPALVVSQTGYGKKGFLQSLRGQLARAGRPSVLVSYRDCARGQPRHARIDLGGCLVEKVHDEANAAAEDAATWLRDKSRYVLMFDAIDDSASREQVFDLIRALWQHQRDGGAVVLSSQPENLKYVLARFGLEEWVVWVRERLPTVDVRGINVNSVRRIATEYEEHRVGAEEMTTVLDFPQRCAAAGAVVKEWLAQPKLFREHGTHSVAPVVSAIRALGPAGCDGWRRGVLAAMLRARMWSYCHDELCNYTTDGDKFLRAARALPAAATVGEDDLTKAAKAEGLRDADELAFPLLSTGVLFLEDGKMYVDGRWLPDAG
jgi:hypothetical protein